MDGIDGLLSARKTHKLTNLMGYGWMDGGKGGWGMDMAAA